MLLRIMYCLAQILVPLVIGVLSATVSHADGPRTIFAAASLQNALNRALADYPEDVRMSLGGSGAIARQVAQGAPADVVYLANPAWMDWLEDQGLIRPGTRHSPVGNTLVVVGPKDAKPLESVGIDHVLSRLANDGRIAMGAHLSVPAGQYAKTWMENMGLWDALRNRLAEVENVRAAMALVARGEVPIAILYRSDVTAAPDSVRIIWDIPKQDQPDIRYAVAAVTENGKALVAYLISQEAQKHFQDAGFRAVAP